MYMVYSPNEYYIPAKGNKYLTVIVSVKKTLAFIYVKIKSPLGNSIPFPSVLSDADTDADSHILPKSVGKVILTYNHNPLSHSDITPSASRQKLMDDGVNGIKR